MVLSKDFKLSICFGLIVGCIISVFQLVGFCVESEQISYDGYLENCSISSSGGIVETNNINLWYLEIEPGYRYTLTATGGESVNRNYAFGNSLQIGSSTTPRTAVSGGTSIIFTYSEYKYLYFYTTAGSSSQQGPFTLTREKLEGLPDFVDNVSYSLSYVNLNNIVDNIVPILAIGVLFGLGFYFIKRILNKFKKAKGGI